MQFVFLKFPGGFCWSFKKQNVSTTGYSRYWAAMTEKANIGWFLDVILQEVT